MNLQSLCHARQPFNQRFSRAALETLHELPALWELIALK
jgi:hypothetical protein